MKDFRTLAVWQKSHELALSIYGETKMFPKEETFGLTSQMRGQLRQFLPILPRAVVGEAMQTCRVFFRSLSARSANWTAN